MENTSQESKEWKGIKASDIDVAKLNVEMKGVQVRVKPLFDIHDGGKQKGFGLNMKMKEEKRFKGSKFAPFFFTDEAEANKAAAMINDWSQDKLAA